MFERFTTSAREVVRGAVRHAEDTGADTVGEAELLLALLDRTDGDRKGVSATGGNRTEDPGGNRTEDPGGRKDRSRTRGDRKGSPAAEVLTALGAHGRRASIERALAEVRRRGGITGADAEALAGLGIDVDEIVARVEEAHGVGALAAAGSTPGATPGPTAGSASARAPRRGRRPRAARSPGRPSRCWSARCGSPSPAATSTSAMSICCSPSPPAPASPRMSWPITT
ncbi:hypothetical protein SSPO_066240 [Streptomyces antimycoticus]|uniref:Clp R domain-containing protein n=1 Tax=Streptomyces antimycoticus TaxID=68175 RepID=A0A499V6H7_9ACTN|nr:hypothetical protein SSPO_066240 [Streptomyces antimycoticus]